MAHLETTATMDMKNEGKIGLEKSAKGDLDWFECFIDPSLLSNPAVGTTKTEAFATIAPKSIAKRPYISPPDSVSPPISALLPASSSSTSGVTTPALSSAPTALPQTCPPSYSFVTNRNKRQKQQVQTQQIPNDKKQKTPGLKNITPFNTVPAIVPRSLQRPGPTLSGLRAANQTLSGFVGAKYSGDINSRSGGIGVKTTTGNVQQTYFPSRDPANPIQQPGHSGHQNHHHHHHCSCHHNCTRDASQSVTVASQDEINHLKTKFEELERIIRELSTKVNSSQV